MKNISQDFINLEVNRVMIKIISNVFDNINSVCLETKPFFDNTVIIK